MQLPPLNWTTVQRKVNDLVPANDNPRKISEAKMAKLIEALAKFNVVGIPAIDFDGNLLNWHQRLKAMQAMGRGEEMIDVRMPNRQLTEKERKEYILLDNQHYGEWDVDALPEFMEGLEMEEFGFSEDDFKDFDTRMEEREQAKKPAKKLEATEDDGPGALPDAGVTVRGDVYELVSVEKGLRHRVMCGDSTVVDDVEKLMGGALADCVVTDPIYGVDYVGKTEDNLPVHNDSKADFKIIIPLALSNVDMFSKPGTPIYCFHPPGENSKLVWRCAEEQDWKFNQQLIWVKSTFVLGHSDYHYQHEPIAFFYKKIDKGRLGRGGIGWYGDNGQTSVLNFDRPNRNAEHPTIKPLELIAKLISNSSDVIHVVLDVFLGSGTTLIACEQLSRQCRGMELAENYCDVIVRRWLAWMEKEGLEYEIHLNGAPIQPERLAQLKRQA